MVESRENVLNSNSVYQLSIIVSKNTAFIQLTVEFAKIYKTI